MSDADEILPFEELEGAHVTLKLVGPSDELVGHFKKFPDMRFAIGAERLPDHKWLTGAIEVEELRVWEIDQNGKHIGYAFFVLYDGPPFIAFYYFGKPSHAFDIGKDCLELLIPVFFKNLDEEALFYYLPKPVDEEIHAELIDGGFDIWDENPTIDNATAACYILERHTYDAYYGDGADEEFEQDDFDD